MSDTTAVLQAVSDGDMPLVRRLLTADPRLASARDECLKTPLHVAAEHERHDIAQVLLDAGADLEATTAWGATPLDWAATMGSTKVADLLLARGAKGMNLVAAASLGKLDLVREFLDSGVSLERGANVNAKGVFGGTGLHCAAINGHKDTVEFLVAHGADLTIRDARFDATLEGWASEGQHYEIRDMLHSS